MRIEALAPDLGICCIPSLVILMAPSFGAGGSMQLCLQCSYDRGLHRFLRPAKSAGHQDDTAFRTNCSQYKF
jgi:hypothetical protein